jgi:hypothetical protein
MADDERASVGVQRAFELADADQVEVVGGFIQQQSRRWLAEQHAGKGRAQPLPTG